MQDISYPKSEGIVPRGHGGYTTRLGTIDEAKKEINALFRRRRDAFDTPKPERLTQAIIEIATNPGDWVLDSFAGSGTTGAVAHKMGRRWIMVELGEHCHTHIIPRLKKVIDGEDKGGITEAVGWKGGGGFRYYRLAPSLLQKDEFGNWVISKEYNPAMLAEAMCKLEGFTYAPSDTVYWQHGHSTETDFIYVTTQTLTREQLQKLSDEVGESRSPPRHVRRIPREESRRVPQPDGEEDSEGGPQPLRMGQGRLQPGDQEPPHEVAGRTGGTGSPLRRAQAPLQGRATGASSALAL